MRTVSYSRVSDVATAVATVMADPDSAFLAGGTNAVDLLRINVEQPRLLVDINDLPLGQITDQRDGGVLIGVNAPMIEGGQAPGGPEPYPVDSQALELGAAPQL